MFERLSILTLIEMPPLLEGSGSQPIRLPSHVVFHSPPYSAARPAHVLHLATNQLV